MLEVELSGGTREWKQALIPDLDNRRNELMCVGHNTVSISDVKRLVYCIAFRCGPSSPNVVTISGCVPPSGDPLGFYVPDYNTNETERYGPIHVYCAVTKFTKI